MAHATLLEAEFAALMLDQILDFVRDNYDINDLYDEKHIERWLEKNAKNYGYVMEK